jgi:hypothetical protein
MIRENPWAKYEKEVSEQEIRASIVGRLMRNEPQIIGSGWKLYSVKRSDNNKYLIYANSRQRIVILFDPDRNPEPDQFKKKISRLNDLRLTFDPPLGSVMGEWEIWSIDDSFF